MCFTTPSETVSDPLCNSFTTPSETVSDKVPSYKVPSLSSVINAECRENHSAKKVRPKTDKRKTWQNKSENERKDTVLNMVCDSHRLALEQNKNVMPYPFTDVPDIVAVILNEYGIEKVKEFLDNRLKEKKGIDIRKFDVEIKNFLSPDKIIHIQQQEEKIYNLDKEPEYYVPVKKRIKLTVQPN